MTAHDYYTCDPACCDSHNGTRCAMCGGPHGEAWVVNYLLGAEADDDDRWGTFREPDRWIVFCGPCDDAWVARWGS